MISLATIHEANITVFQRNHYLINISELQNKSLIGHEDIECEEHISIETVRELFPNATLDGIVSIILTSIQMKMLEGGRRFLLTFTDGTKRESMDLLNELAHVLQLEATTDEQRKYFDLLNAQAGIWTEAICRVEKKSRMVQNTLNSLWKLC